MSQPQIASPEPAPTDVEEPYPSNFYAWYCVILLMGIYVNSFLDRSILGLLVEPIRADTGLSDSDLGFLMGPAFAIFYTIAGLPIGWLADRMSRRLLVAIGQVFWSIASVGFGMSSTFAQMVVARVGVGVGEASLSPSAYSLVTDLFRPERLAFALSVYGMGIFLGAGLANLAGGYVLDFVNAGATYTVPFAGERKAWQIVFFIIAAPTIPLTLLLLTFREPKRRGLARVAVAGATTQTAQPSLPVFLRYARRNLGTILCHNIGFAWLSFSGYGLGSWTPAFFARLHGWELAFIGKLLGVTSLVLGPLGILFGGWLGDRLHKAGYVDSKMRVGLIAAVAWIPFGVAFPLMPTPELAFALLAPATFIGAMSWGVAPAAIQEIMPNQMRGQASAIYLFIVNMLGLAGGPYLLALLTDLVFVDDMKIHYSLVFVGLGAHVLSGTFLFFGLRRFRETRAALDAAS